MRSSLYDSWTQNKIRLTEDHYKDRARKTYDEAMADSLNYFGGDELAASTFVGKYALKYPKQIEEMGSEDILNEKDKYWYLETNPAQMHERIAVELTRIEEKYSGTYNFDTFYYALDHFKYIVPGGSPMYGIGNPYSIVSLSNCIVTPKPGDSLSGIINIARDIANLSKRRCGVGTCLDSLRPAGAAVRNSAGTSTGAWSFANYYSETGQMVGQNGRRAALMLTMSVRHPDVENFIIMKHDLTKVTGANVSVTLTDDFMKAVEEDKDWILRWPVDKSPEEARFTKTIKAKDLWHLINESATKTAEPGLIFWDNYCNNLPANEYSHFKSVCVNPCVTGDTLVAVADGRGSVSFKELAEKDEDVLVYCMDNEHKTVIRWMRSPRKTRDNVPVYKVTLDDGSIIKCTENHKFYIRNYGQKEVKDLLPGDSFFVMNREILNLKEMIGSQKRHKADYYWVKIGGRYKSEHRLIAGFIYDHDLTKDEVVHHKDFNSLNNSPENLLIMSSKDHYMYHGTMKLGENNPMCIALKTWSPERKEQYCQLQSELNTGEKNNRYLGVSHEQLKEHALLLTKELGRRFSQKDWQKYAKENNLPLDFSKWRKDHLGGVVGLAKWAALSLNYENIDVDTRIVRHYLELTEKGYNCEIVNGCCFINKLCEKCGASFSVSFDRRHVSFCSHHCAAYVGANTVGRIEKVRETYKNKCDINRIKQIEIYNDLKFQLNREPLCIEWENECAKNGTPHRLGKASGTFRLYSDLEEEAATYNHKVVSVEFCGYEDVYNGTVDEFHNYFIGGFKSINKFKKARETYVCSSNCSEIMLSELDSCRLTSVNLKSLVNNPYTELAYFDFDLFETVVRTGMHVMDNIINLEIECLDNVLKLADDPDEQILWTTLKENAIRGRRTGLGTHGLADCLSSLGLKYDTEEAMEMTDKIFGLFRNYSYDESVNLAIQRGSFPEFDWEIEKNNIFIKRLPEELQKRIEENGRRNISLLTCAPTGSVSLVSQTSSGVEPQFQNFYVRRKKINPSDPDQEVDFTDKSGDKWKEYFVLNHGVAAYFQQNEEAQKQWGAIQETMPKSVWAEEITKLLPDYFVTSQSIDPMMRVKIQSTMQQYLDHGISSTINLPKGTSVEQVEQIYLESWKQGLKGITVYVDGSRSGVMISATDDEKYELDKHGRPYKLVPSNSPTRPKELLCEIHRSNIDEQKWTILVGLMNGVPYEVFGGLSENFELPRKYTTGKIIKRKCEKANAKGRKNCYDLVAGDEDDPLTIKDIVVLFDSAQYAVETRRLSLELRHGIPIPFINEQLVSDQNHNLFSFHRVMARVLKKYIPADEEKMKDPTYDPSCPTGKCE